MDSQEDIEFFFLKEEDFDEVIAFLNSDYCCREPLQTMGFRLLNVDMGKGRAAEDIRQCLKSGLSVAARDKNTGEMVGSRTCFISYRNDSQTSTQPTYDLEQIYGVYNKVMDNVYKEKADRILQMFYLSVRKDYEGRGIARKMVQMCMEAGHAQGAEIAATCITNIQSGKVFQKLGYEVKFTLDFEAPGVEWEPDVSAMPPGNSIARLFTKMLP